MDNDEKECSVCGGTGVNKPQIQDLNNEQEIEFHPIECQHCRGTGKEPN